MVECRTVQDIVEEDPEYTIIYHWQALTISTTQVIPESSISATHGWMDYVKHAQKASRGKQQT